MAERRALSGIILRSRFGVVEFLKNGLRELSYRLHDGIASLYRPLSWLRHCILRHACNKPQGLVMFRSLSEMLVCEAFSQPLSACASTGIGPNRVLMNRLLEIKGA
jgi:hypothetical protein